MSENKEKKTKESEEESEEKELSFLDHLGELRKRIIYAVIGIFVGAGVSALFIDFIMDTALLGPAVDNGLVLQNLRTFGQPIVFFKVVAIVGVIISFPHTLYQLWKFIAPGLYENEKSWVRVITFFTSLCFMVGIAFAYFVMIPSMLSFAASFGTEQIKNNIDINEYFSFISTILLAAGLFFELPMVSFVLSRFGMLKAKTMRKFRRHGIIVILLLAAILTPTPDPVSQLIFAIPLFFLYELSVLIAVFGEKKYNSKN